MWDLGLDPYPLQENKCFTPGVVSPAPALVLEETSMGKAGNIKAKFIFWLPFLVPNGWTWDHEAHIPT